jgi:lipoprotein signal peptidase
MRTFWGTALLVSFVDGVTKWYAQLYSPTVVYNLGQTRFGMPLNVQVAITLAMIFALLVVIIQQRHRVPGLDYMAGMMMGGAIANVVSLVAGPPGVLDFIRIGDIVFNIADVFLWVGAPGLIYVVARAVVREQR